MESWIVYGRLLHITSYHWHTIVCLFYDVFFCSFWMIYFISIHVSIHFMCSLECMHFGSIRQTTSRCGPEGWHTSPKLAELVEAVTNGIHRSKRRANTLVYTWAVFGNQCSRDISWHIRTYHDISWGNEWQCNALHGAQLRATVFVRVRRLGWSIMFLSDNSNPKRFAHLSSKQIEETNPTTQIIALFPMQPGHDTRQLGVVTSSGYQATLESSFFPQPDPKRAYILISAGFSFSPHKMLAEVAHEPWVLPVLCNVFWQSIMENMEPNGIE